MKNKKIWREIRRACSLLLYVLMVALLLIGLYPVVARTVFGIQHPSLFGCSAAVVISGSMADSIAVNDIVIIQKQDAYAEGDIISFENGNMLITHRIIAQEDGAFITKGDANNTADPFPVSPPQIAGKVVLIIPKLGVMIQFFNTPAGRGMLFVAAVLLVIVPARIQRGTNGGADDEIK